jgi:hypothetical protein
MKELIIVFLVALAISSLFNGWNPFASNAPTDQTVVNQSSVESDQSSAQSNAANQAAQQTAPSSSPSTPNGSAL